MMPDITYTDQYINEGQSAPTGLHKFYDTILMTNEENKDHIFRIPLYDTFLKYRQHFQEAVVIYQMPRSQFYQPKTVSLELYGTTEMWLALLRLNSMRNISEFKKQIIKVYDASAVQELIEIFFAREGKIG